jgi:hypothetical protein
MNSCHMSPFYDILRKNSTFIYIYKFVLYYSISICYMYCTFLVEKYNKSFCRCSTVHFRTISFFANQQLDLWDPCVGLTNPIVHLQKGWAKWCAISLILIFLKNVSLHSSIYLAYISTELTYILHFSFLIESEWSMPTLQKCTWDERKKNEACQFYIDVREMNAIIQKKSISLFFFIYLFIYYIIHYINRLNHHTINELGHYFFLFFLTITEKYQLLCIFSLSFFTIQTGLRTHLIKLDLSKRWGCS